MIIGIDFGTSYCKPSFFEMGRSQLLLEHEAGIPSVFCYDGRCELFGQEALDRQSGNESLEVLRHFKMHLFESLECNGVRFPARDIVREMYRHIFEITDKRLSEEYDISEYQGVVLSMPVCFGYSERRLYCDLIESLHRKGAMVVGIIKEPVAAALAYYEKTKNNNGNIMVFDLGGGTCDVAIVERRQDMIQKYEVIASSGIARGGKDFDERIVDYVYRKIKDDYEYDMSQDPADRYKVYNASVRMKYGLSEKDEVRKNIVIDGKTIPFSINNETLYELSMDILDDIKQLILRTSPYWQTFDTVICVGGGSRMRIIQNLLHEIFPDCNILKYKPEHAVPLGNAVYARLLEEHGASSLPVIKDKSAFAYGVKMTGSKKEWIYNVIKSNDEYPCRKKITCKVDGSGFSLFSIYQSESISKRDPLTTQEPIGRLPFRYPISDTKSVSLVFELTEKGVLEVYIKDSHGNYTYYDLETGN